MIKTKTSINLNENIDSLVLASKISDMPNGWICGQTARDFVQIKVGVGGSMNIQESNEFKTSKFFCKTESEIKNEESEYVSLPKFYKFKSYDERERILCKNFVQVGQDVKGMIADINNKKNAK